VVAGYSHSTRGAGQTVSIGSTLDRKDAMTLIARLDAVRARRNILEHPFYTRWEHGDLTREELAAYAGEYRHAVVALADAAHSAAPLAGEEHAREEREHVTLWDAFAAELNADLHRAPSPETERCASAWTAAADPLEALAILYAIEAGQPEVSETKLRGLVDHYGSRSAATEPRTSGSTRRGTTSTPPSRADCSSDTRRRTTRTVSSRPPKRR
jgi:pyrroloquinoline quinone (PQQ) biosynthesis protein C